MSCIFPQCENTKYFCKNSNIRFFKVPTFPKKNAGSGWKCVKFVSMICQRPMVCSKHFIESDITVKTKRVRLDRDAVPINTSQLNEFIGNEQYVEEYLEEYIEECDDFLGGYNKIRSEGISQKVVRKSYTSISTQTDISLQDYQLEIDKQVHNLKEKIASLEFLISTLTNNEAVPKLNPSKSLSILPKIPRYKLEDISFATFLYSAGPRSYKFLRKSDYPLPSPSTLRRWATKLCVEPGIQKQTLSHMGSFELDIEQKLCVLCFDEMKCREEWAYDRKNDLILQPKRMVQVAMVRGLRGNWKQPIFYDFDMKMQKTLLLNIISELYKIGFTVVAAVSDLGIENQQLWRSMDISPEKNFFKHPSDENKLIFVFADVPHLIKLLRNHFVDDGYFFRNTILNKLIVEELISLCDFDLNISKKLSLEMLNVKGAARQKVKTATKLKKIIT